MHLQSIFPRSLGESSSDCAGILTSIIMTAHLDRSLARALGWRGIRPSAAYAHPAWTCKVAGSESVFGIRFDGEENDSVHEWLHGYFSLYIFPQAESSLLNLFPLAALQFALSPDYTQAVRGFSGNEETLLPFLLGQLQMAAAFSGDALALTMEAPARHQILCPEGIAAGEEWLVAPGTPECNIPAFRLFLRFFAVLVGTVEQEFAENAQISRSLISRDHAASLQNAKNDARHEQEKILRITASFGTKISYAAGCMQPMQHMPARYKAENPEDHARPVLHILSGFLGSGKTTFLRRWLDFLHGRERYTGVIQNEFGNVALDALLMKNDTLVEALDDGCVCCSLAASLRPGLERIIAAMPAEQFILETTGLANPENIIQTLDTLRDLVKIGMVITVIDAFDLCKTQNISASSENYGIRHAQLKYADVIILNKSDLVTDSAMQNLVLRIQKINSMALLLPASYGNIPFAELDAWADMHREMHNQSSHGHCRHECEAITHAEEGYTAITLTGEMTKSGLESMLHAARSQICRAKGIISLAEQGVCIVQYAAGQLEIIPAPDEMPIGIVVIGKKDYLQHQFPCLAKHSQ